MLNKKRAFIFVIIASVLYGLLPLVSKLIVSGGLNSESAIFYRFLFSFVFSFCILKYKKTNLKVSKKQLSELFIYGLFGFALTMALLILSYDYIDTGLAMMLHFSYPLFVNLFIMFFFKEKLSKNKIISCMLLVITILLLSNVKSTVSSFGLILALLSGITYAVFIIASKRSSIASVNPVVSIMYMSMFAAVTYGIFFSLNGDLMLISSINSFVGVILISLVCTVIALYFLTLGVRTLGSSTASIINMLEPMTSIVIGILFLKEALTINIVIAVLLTIISTKIVLKD